MGGGRLGVGVAGGAAAAVVVDGTAAVPRAAAEPRLGLSVVGGADAAVAADSAAAVERRFGSGVADGAAAAVGF